MNTEKTLLQQKEEELTRLEEEARMLAEEEKSIQINIDEKEIEE